MSTLILGVGLVVVLILIFGVIVSFFGPKQDRDIPPIPGLEKRQQLSKKHAEHVGRGFAQE